MILLPSQSGRRKMDFKNNLRKFSKKHTTPFGQGSDFVWGAKAGEDTTSITSVFT
jgi:hypothetical protein